MTDETEMILVWIWHNTKDSDDYQPDYPEWVLYYWPDHKDQERYHCVKTDLLTHPMHKEIKALADLAGPDPDYKDGTVSEDFTIPSEWWGDPVLINTDN